MEAEGKRINKYISDAGVCSRRAADVLIEKGDVEISRKPMKHMAATPSFRASIGDRVFPGDTVCVKGRELPKKEAEKKYYIYNKPVGIICTADSNVQNNIYLATGLATSYHYSGRLDKDTSGLIIMTNDGEIIDRMMRGNAGHEKEYICLVDKKMDDSFAESMSRGVKIYIDDDTTVRKYGKGIFVTTEPCRVRVLSDRKFAITITRGRNRQIRRMCKTLGYNVTSLKRIRIADIKLGDLSEGELKRLSPAEIKRLKARLNYG